jgi:hypothetical protein
LPSGEYDPSTGAPLNSDEDLEYPKFFKETESGIVVINSKVFAL